jgi:hypothetical protein
MKNCFLFDVRGTTEKHTGGERKEREKKNIIFTLSL